MPIDPKAWADLLNEKLNRRTALDWRALDIPRLARHWSAEMFPGDPVTHVSSADLPGFEGALLRVPDGVGWGILYNHSVRSTGRMNFTLAHELGHYLMHRNSHSGGLRCSANDMVGAVSAIRPIEREANTFAAQFLMPLADFQQQIGLSEEPDLGALSDCASRYGVSLLAASLRWISYTALRAVLVVSRDGFILWARSSQSAMRAGIYFRTTGAPVPTPTSSLAARQGALGSGRFEARFGPDVWFQMESKEMMLFSLQYDFAISVVVLEPTD